MAFNLSVVYIFLVKTWSISQLMETDIGEKGNDTLLVETGIALHSIDQK
jgi:hypothetical protein